VPPFVLTVLKIALLILLYFFIWRATRTVVLDLYGGREPRRGRTAQPKPRPARRGKVPTKLLVLDEVTTSLDPRTEAAICETLRELRGSVTIVAISHQPAMMEVADVVYWVEDGRVSALSALPRPAPTSPAGWSTCCGRDGT
jgi:hypothetical protein